MTFTAPHYVYRLFDADDQLLYVGCSRNLEGRRRDHARTQYWWGLVATYRLTGPFADRREALDYERAAIRAEVPRFNEQSNVNFVYTDETRRERLRLMNERWFATASP